jgi:hypothetical protein
MIPTSATASHLSAALYRGRPTLFTAVLFGKVLIRSGDGGECKGERGGLRRRGGSGCSEAVSAVAAEKLGHLGSVVLYL